jgi:outer membrane receptor protein involved in Fe transport
MQAGTLAPDTVERIEVMRAPTAEFSSEGIAGTINIVLKKTAHKPQRELKLGYGAGRDTRSPNASLRLAGRSDAFSYDLAGSLVHDKIPRRGAGTRGRDRRRRTPDDAAHHGRPRGRPDDDAEPGAQAGVEARWRRRAGPGELPEPQPLPRRRERTHHHPAWVFAALSGQADRHGQRQRRRAQHAALDARAGLRRQAGREAGRVRRPHRQHQHAHRRRQSGSRAARPA